MHRVGAIAAGVVASFGFFACSLTVDVDNLTNGGNGGDAGSETSGSVGGGDGGIDATVTTGEGDGSAAGQAVGDAASDGPVDATTNAGDGGDGGETPDNLVANGGFETENGVGCGPDWIGTSSTNIYASPRAHNGAYACLVCNNFQIQMTIGTPLDGGGSVGVVRGYARVVQQDGSDGGFVAAATSCSTLADGGKPVCATMTIFNYLPGDGGMIQRNYAPTAIGSDWTAFGEEEPLNGLGSIEVGAGFGNVPAGDCVLLDDVTLTYQN